MSIDNQIHISINIKYNNNHILYSTSDLIKFAQCFIMRSDLKVSNIKKNLQMNIINISQMVFLLYNLI